jgi:hemerythrin
MSMALIEWRSEFETGIADVDHEHRELVELINKLHEQLGSEMTSEVISNFLGEVFARISAHFALEESIMRKHDYDQYNDHKSDHEKLLDDIRDIMDDYEAGKYIAYDEALASAVCDWFVDHFKTKDARLHAILGV